MGAGTPNPAPLKRGLPYQLERGRVFFVCGFWTGLV